MLCICWSPIGLIGKMPPTFHQQLSQYHFRVCDLATDDWGLFGFIPGMWQIIGNQYRLYDHRRRLQVVRDIYCQYSPMYRPDNWGGRGGYATLAYRPRHMVAAHQEGICRPLQTASGSLPSFKWWVCQWHQPNYKSTLSPAVLDVRFRAHTVWNADWQVTDQWLTYSQWLPIHGTSDLVYSTSRL